jgi:ribosome-associated toxin RatA of RatAB toxin-antitoxin module
MTAIFKLLIVALLLLSGLARAGETLVKVRQDGMLLKVEGWLTTPVDESTAWEVLTDYSNFPVFVPGVRSNRVTDSRGNVKMVAQQGEMAVGNLRMPYEGTMRIEEEPGEGLNILFLSGLFKDVQGQWRMNGGKPLKLTYRMQLDLMKTIIPAPLVSPMAESQVRMWVTVFAHEMERRQKR